MKLVVAALMLATTVASAETKKPTAKEAVAAAGKWLKDVGKKNDKAVADETALPFWYAEPGNDLDVKKPADLKAMLKQLRGTTDEVTRALSRDPIEIKVWSFDTVIGDTDAETKMHELEKTHVFVLALVQGNKKDDAPMQMFLTLRLDGDKVKVDGIVNDNQSVE